MSINKAMSASVSPSKYNRMNSLLSQIEENVEIDEKSDRDSKLSNTSSVSPCSKIGSSSNIFTFELIEAYKNRPEQIFNFGHIRNSPLRTGERENPLHLKYSPNDENDQKSKFQYENFDDYFQANFVKNDKNKFEKRYTEFDIAEKFLKCYGKSVLDFVKHPKSENSPGDSSATASVSKSSRPKRRKLKKKLVKRKKSKLVVHEKVSHMKQISSKLVALEQELFDKNAPEDLINQNKKASDKLYKAKRTRFKTWDVNDGLNFQKSPTILNDDEQSVGLADGEDEYLDGFKNYSFKQYEKQRPSGEERRVTYDAELKINLNPCLPIIYDNRKVSYNSYNQANSDEMGICEDSFRKESNICQASHSSYITNKKFTFSGINDQTSLQAKPKRKRLMTTNTEYDQGNISNAKKRAKYRKQKKLINTSDMNLFLRSFEQHCNQRQNSNPFNSKSSMSSSYVSPELKSINKPSLKSSESSIGKSDEVRISKSKFKKPAKRMSSKMSFHSQKHVPETIEVPTEIVDNLKELADEMDKS